MSSPTWLTDHIHDVPDYPVDGVLFKDITPLLGNPVAFGRVISSMAERWQPHSIEAVAGIEARGFLTAAPLAIALGVPLVPVRKPNKLPRTTASHTYDLEYGTDTLEVHTDAVAPGARVLVTDDVLATGGTASATVALLEGIGANVVGLAFIMELTFLSGRDKLGSVDISALVAY